jgi:hypothetical protein
MDGVLIDCKDIHRHSFISTWNNEVPMYPITISLHNDKLEGRNIYYRTLTNFCRKIKLLPR